MLSGDYNVKGVGLSHTKMRGFGGERVINLMLCNRQQPAEPLQGQSLVLDCTLNPTTVN